MWHDLQRFLPPSTWVEDAMPGFCLLVGMVT
jgi:hypothetical protein